METRDWIRDGFRAVAWGALSIGLALLNLPLIVLFVLSLILTPVLGLGLFLLPPVTRLIRLRAGLSRTLAGRWGVPIERPYRPPPPDIPSADRPGHRSSRLRSSRPRSSHLRSSRLGWARCRWARFRWVVTDSATWRDVAWLLPGAVIGLGLGVLSLVLPAYGLLGVVLIPLWIWLGTGWYGYGAIWPIHSIGEGLLSLPQGVLILGVGLALASYLRRFDALFARLLLAPTRGAQLRLRVTELTVTRSDTIDAQAAELRRIERDLHDGAQARLVSLGMAIGLAEEIVESDPATARRLLAEARESSSTALVELRHLVRGIHPPVLAERGLDGAVRALALHLPLPVDVDSDLTGRLPPPVESAAYFAVAEALANMARHSGGRFASVVLRCDRERLHLEVVDDGHGGADPRGGTGLRGIERRLAAFDGTMALSSPPGGPTVVTMELPCVSSSPRTMLSSGTG